MVKMNVQVCEKTSALIVYKACIGTWTEREGLEVNSIGISTTSTFAVYVFDSVTQLSNKVSVECNRGKSFIAPYRYCVLL